MLTKGAIGNLVNRYKAVLRKCNLINTFGSLAVAAALVLGGAGVAEASVWQAGDDKSYATLSEALAKTNDGGTVKLLSDATGAGATINQSVTIDLDGHTYTINDGTVEKLSYDKYGGAIAVMKGSLNVNGTNFYSNKASGNHYGGAIFSYSGTIVDITGATFKENEGYAGGAIFISNKLIMNEGSFTKNTADFGGGIYGANTTDITISGTKFIENEAKAGGAIEALGSLSLSEATFTKNRATDTNLGGGGALFLGSESSTAVFSKTLFEGNTSAENGGAIAGRDCDTGAPRWQYALIMNFNQDTHRLSTFCHGNRHLYLTLYRKPTID